MIPRGDYSPIDLVEQCLARIDEREVELHAWVVVDREGARQRAKELEASGRKEDQPLWGIPVGIKDIIDVAGFPTRCGATWKVEPPPAAHDAFVVERLRAAGAIILGKTVTTEWACFDPPPTRNPYNLERTPGGSSSGSAVAVATGMCLAAIGTQTGGSILRPASYCGICGLKPAHRPEMLRGVALVAESLDHVGPMAETVADLKTLWDVLRPDSITPKAGETASIATVVDPFIWQHANSQLMSQFKAVMERLRAQFRIGTFYPPMPFADIHRRHRIIMAIQACGVHEDRFNAEPETFGPSVQGLIEEGMHTPVSHFMEAINDHDQLSADLRLNFPPATIFAMPTTLTAAPGRETTGDPRFNSPWSFLGLPALTLPCGRSSDGLPYGLQLIGPDEETLLAAGVQVERLLAMQ